MISGMTAEACKRDADFERMKEISQLGRKQLTRLLHSDIGLQMATTELGLLPVSDMLTYLANVLFKCLLIIIEGWLGSTCNT